MADAIDRTEISGDTLIGDIIEKLPGGADVIEKYFGNGCFTCPGVRMESINFGATMHGVDPQLIVDELLELARGEG